MSTFLQYLPWLSGPLGALVGALVARWNAKTAVDQKREISQVDRENLALQLLRDELTKREDELKAIRAQDRADRDVFVRTLTSIDSSMKTMSETLSVMKTDTQGRLDALHERALLIETHLGLPGRES